MPAPRAATCRPRRSSRMPRRGDAASVASLQRYEERLARSLAHVDQRARSGRHRARRRHVEHGSAVRHGAVAVGPLDILGPRRHQARCATCMATRAACAARRGCGLASDANFDRLHRNSVSTLFHWSVAYGRRRARSSHVRVVGPAAALGRHPVDILPGILDVAGLAVDAILRVDLQPLGLTPDPSSAGRGNRRRRTRTRRPGNSALPDRRTP